MKKLIKNTHKPVDNDKNVVSASNTKPVRDYGPDENGLYGPFKTAEEMMEHIFNSDDDDEDEDI